MNSFRGSLLRFLFLTALCAPVAAQEFPIAEGWARTKVNTAIFRHNAVVSLGERQVAAFYDASGRVVLAERTHGSADWTIQVTPLRGRVADAHNGISIAFDGSAVLHMSWDHHGDPLHYCRSKGPGTLDLQEPESMVGTLEDRVTYPEFYQLPDGNLLFFYREGSSGNGNLVLNRWDRHSGRWHRMHDNLIDGEATRNAYWQVAVDRLGQVHLSWVWRETGDVVTNHDIAYARSPDGGITWQTTSGAQYELPIREATAEYAVRIPQNSELANQTSMAADHAGNPVIANFWRDAPNAVPQYRLVRFDGTSWTVQQVGQRTLNFYREGGGTKRPPVSRPVLLLDSNEHRTRAFMLFRDQERGKHISVAMCAALDQPMWEFVDLTPRSVGQSDPLHDPVIWQQKKQIHLLTQFVGQGDGEREEDVPPQMVSVMVWTPPASD